MAVGLAVRLGAAAEAVALDDASEPLAFARPGHVDEIADLEDVTTDFNAGFGQRKRITRALKGHMKDFGQFQVLREFRTDDVESAEAGVKVSCDIFEVGDLVDVSGTTKGKGFAGVVKRWGFHGGPKTHGQSDRHRAPGSIGAGTSPGRVIKGKKMAGHMGTGEATVKNLKVVRVDADKGILFVRGPVPGNEGIVVRIRRSPALKVKQ